jgi:hypothetical protein
MQLLVKYGGEFAKLVADYGKKFDRVRVLDGLTGTGEHKMCFSNAANAILCRAGSTFNPPVKLKYVEGYAKSKAVPVRMSFHHAWLVDDDGAVIDPTWEDGFDYIGIIFPHWLLAEILLTTKHFSIYNRAGFDILHNYLMEVNDVSHKRISNEGYKPSGPQESHQAARRV